MTVYIVDHLDQKLRYTVTTVENFKLYTDILNDKEDNKDSNLIKVDNTNGDYYITILKYNTNTTAACNAMRILSQYVLLHAENIDQERVPLTKPCVTIIKKLYKNCIDIVLFTDIQNRIDKSVDIVYDLLYLYDIACVLGIKTLENKVSTLLSINIKKRINMKKGIYIEAIKLIDMINKHYALTE